MKLKIVCTWDELISEESTSNTVHVSDVHQAAGLPDADRCSGPNSCSIDCDGVTFTLTGFSDLCQCSTSNGVLRLNCMAQECPDLEIRCNHD